MILVRVLPGQTLVHMPNGEGVSWPACFETLTDADLSCPIWSLSVGTGSGQPILVLFADKTLHPRLRTLPRYGAFRQCLLKIRSTLSKTR